MSRTRDRRFPPKTTPSQSAELYTCGALKSGDSHDCCHAHGALDWKIINTLRCIEKPMHKEVSFFPASISKILGNRRKVISVLILKYIGFGVYFLPNQGPLFLVTGPLVGAAVALGNR